MSKTYQCTINNSNLYQPWVSSCFDSKIVNMLLRRWNVQERDYLSWRKAVVYILSLGADVDPSSLPSVALTQKTKLPSVSGIYFAIAKNKILYIGRAQNIRERWFSHHRYQELQKFIGVRLHWIKCEISQLLGVEYECIALFQPSFNYQPIAKEPKKKSIKPKPNPFHDYKYHLARLDSVCPACGWHSVEKVPFHCGDLHYYRVACACCNYRHKSESHPEHQATLDNLRTRIDFLLECKLTLLDREVVEWAKEFETFTGVYRLVQRLYKKHSRRYR